MRDFEYLLEQQRLTDEPKSIAGAIKDRIMPKIKTELKTIETLKPELLSIFNDKDLNISTETRNKNIHALNKIKSYTNMVSFAYNLALAGDGLKTIK